MTTAPTLPPIGFYTQNASAYLRSLQAGQKPDIRPDFGPLEPVIREAESGFDNLKPEQRPALMPKILNGMCNMKKLKRFDVRGLLDNAQTFFAQQGEEHPHIPALPKYAQIPPAVSAGACPELEWYENFSKKASDRAWQEYHQFCGLWLFSVIAGRRPYLQIGQKKFYTNLMLAQCGATSFYAKSFTANIAKNVLYELGLGYTLAPNRITPQKLLSDMAGAHVPTNFDELSEEKQDRVRRRLGSPGQKGLLYDELGLFIQSMLRKQSTNADFADLLMTFDECPPEYENSTIARGGESIEKPYLTLLGNMTPANLKQNAKAGADFWNDGFWARISFVVAPPPPTATDDDPGPPQVSELDDLELPIPPALLQSLREWHERLGIPVCHLEPKFKGDKFTGYEIHRADLVETPCTITLEARQAWVNYEYALRMLVTKLGHHDFNGSYVRLAETAMRIAVLLASLSNNGHIELKHWAKAQELTEILRKNLHELYAQVNEGGDIPVTFGKTVEEKVLAKVEELARRGAPANMRDLVRYLKSFSSGQLKTAVIDLSRVKLLREEKVGKTIRYFPGIEDDGDG